MANFGDLPRGEIPEPLKYNRPMCKERVFSLFSFPNALNLKLFIYYNCFDIDREHNTWKRNQSCHGKIQLPNRQRWSLHWSRIPPGHS